jgi:hypothetical protein
MSQLAEAADRRLNDLGVSLSPAFMSALALSRVGLKRVLEVGHAK